MTLNRTQAKADFIDVLTKSNRKLRTYFDARVKEYGLTLARARTLMLLRQQDSATQSELATLLEIEKPTLVRLLDGLEKQGWTRRDTVDSDRRANKIVLTDEGRLLADRINRLAEEIRHQLLLEVSDEDIATATRVLRSFTLAIDGLKL
jgi:MarR family transcriptional regulator for hemolysin